MSNRYLKDRYSTYLLVFERGGQTTTKSKDEKPTKTRFCQTRILLFRFLFMLIAGLPWQ